MRGPGHRYLGRPCRRCGCRERYARSRNCVPCAGQHSRAQYRRTKKIAALVAAPRTPDTRIEAFAAWLDRA